MLDYETQNKSRKVRGPVANIECGLPREFSTAPFGNWGVETETSRRYDGHQFQGWCQRTYACHTNDPTECTTYCNDNWYEWNSCTNDARFAPRNTQLYNDDNGRKQKSKLSSANTHGSGRLNLAVPCPADTDGDYIPDEGGCKDVLDYTFSLSGHRMELWELDHWRPWDDKVGTIYFPTLTASGSGTNCDIYGCDGGTVGSFRSKNSGTNIVCATAAVRVTGAVFVNDKVLCCDPLEDPTCN